MAVLLQEVVLDHPGGVDPDAVGELTLLDGLLEHGPLRTLVPGPGQLVLEEEADLHATCILPLPLAGRGYLLHR